MKKIIPILLGSLVLAYGQDYSEKNITSANNPSPKKLRVAVVTNTKNDFWEAVRYGCNSAVQNLGDVQLDFRYLTNPTAEAQDAMVSDLVAANVDGIAISPVDADKQTEFLNQVAAKTLLICVDSDAPNSKRVCFIGSNNVLGGRQEADLLKAALPQGGKVVICVGYLNAQNAKDRIQGLKEGLAGSKIQIIDTLADETKVDVAEKNAALALEKHPDLAGIVGLYSYNGPAILKAVRAAGKVGKVQIVCFDDNRATLNGIAVGDIHGTVVQLPALMGYETVSRMSKYLEGDKTQLSAGEVLLGTFPVDQITVEAVQYYRQNLLQGPPAQPVRFMVP